MPRKLFLPTLPLLLAITASTAHAADSPATGPTFPPRIAIERAPAPLYDDPLFHGASDPAVIWLPSKGPAAKGQFWMFYTQRRATLPNPNGVDWVHGSAIGIATSNDGLHWSYLDVAHGNLTDGTSQKSLENSVRDNVTWWAPTIFWEHGNGISGGGGPGDTLHMFVTRVHGIFSAWTGDRTIEHFTSTDAFHWTHISSLPLASRRVIDPTVLRINDTWYLWYKNEAAGSRTFRASSKDLTTWHDDGDAHIGRGHEAPFLWHWKSAYWDLQDNGRALDAWRSPTALQNDWSPNSLLLEPTPPAPPGTRPLDQGTGHHPWIILQSPNDSTPLTDDNAQLLLFYFTHNGNKTYIQLAEITLDQDGKLQCDRNKYAPPPTTQGNP
ncbi:MAG TPA: hypothetical protein VM008_08780 [Phycisphaerae bacterium]|nr:hypothetical protein [Phycisphaerae bacterium]